MMLLVLKHILIFSLATHQVSSFVHKSEDDLACTTPYNKPGRCIGLRKCRNVLELLRRPIPQDVLWYIRRSVCKFEGFLPDVCCPSERVVIGNQEATTAPTTTTNIPAVDGSWGAWSIWGVCSASCGGGVEVRRRKCDNPPPSNGGSTCQGEDEDSRKCGEIKCNTGVEIPTDCGVRNGGNFRVVGGKPAKLNSWPWIAALGYTDPHSVGVKYLCGGTLITTKHILTAAHCINDDLKTVLLGDHVIGDDNDGANPEEYEIANVFKHESYNSRSYNNDIAVLELAEEVTFKKGISPACLPSTSPSLLQEKFVKEGAYVVGWGAVHFRGPQSNELLEGLISVVTNEECETKFKSFRHIKINDKKMCARDLNNRIDACQGDSGGPLIIQKRADDRRYRFFVVGVVSFGYRCAVKGFPGVYTRVSEFDNWIREKVKA